MRALIALLVWLITTPAPAQPMVTIDCGKPMVPTDRLVCADENLAALNHAMAERYQILRRAMSPEGFALARMAQQDWLKGVRTTCAPGAEREGATKTPEAAAECIGEAYRERGSAIDATVRIAGTLVLEGRQQVRRWCKPKVTETNRYPSLAGAPTGKAAAFNRYITQTLKPAQSLYLRSGVKPDPTAPGETVFDRFYEIHRFDDRLISIEIFDHHEANFGHGWRSEFIINWNLSHNRPLDLGDVFVTGHDWQRPIAEFVLKSAREDYDPKYVESVVSPEALDNIGAWLFGDDSATLVLDHGERSMVGASIEVAVPYDVLAPYMRSDAPLLGAGSK